MVNDNSILHSNLHDGIKGTNQASPEQFPDKFVRHTRSCQASTTGFPLWVLYFLIRA